jgi:tRNA(Ile)-lysidine synthase
MGRETEDGRALERRLLKRVTHLLKELGRARCSQPLIVAVSGGPDSMALLLLLSELRKPLGLNLHVAHLDHGLRGRESQEDAQFVKGVATRLSIPVTLGQEYVESYRTTRRLSLEEAAREVRYSFLSKVAAAQQADTIVLGHTADDQAETILMHLLRGSGLAGLAGMSSLARWPSSHNEQSVSLMRPLLEIRRVETVTYCLWKEITPREDPTNLSLQFTRNRLRADLIPRLESYNPKFQEALLRLSRSASQDQAYILEEAVQAKNRLASDSGDGITIERNGFAALAETLKRHLLRLVYEEIKGSSHGLEHRHLEEMVKLATTSTGKEIDLPNRLVYSVGHEFIRLGFGKSKPPDAPIVVGEYPLTVPGDVRIPGWTVRALLSAEESEISTVGAYSVRLNEGSVGRKLLLRGRKPGDRFQPIGMTGSKTLQDFMVDEKVPQEMRDRVPLVLSGTKIAWVVGHRIADWAKLTEDTTEVVSLEFSPAT